MFFSGFRFLIFAAVFVFSIAGLAPLARYFVMNYMDVIHNKVPRQRGETRNAQVNINRKC